MTWLAKNPRVRIRVATLEDVTCMLQIEKGSYRTGRFTERQFRYLVTRARGAAWVAVDPGPSRNSVIPAKARVHYQLSKVAAPGPDCLGFLILLAPKLWSSARIYNIATTRQARGRGVATALMNHAHNWARAHGYRRLHLEVDRRNDTAITFYERMGFVRDRLLRDYYGDRRHGWRYVLD